MNRKTNKILLWCKIKPIKQGSFEDYLCEIIKKSSEFNCHLSICCISPANSSIRYLATRENVNLIEVSEKEISSSITLIKHLISIKPDILHMHFTGPYDWILFSSKLLWSGKLMVTDHSSGEHLVTNKLVENIKKIKRLFISRYVDLYVPVSEYVKNRLITNLNTIEKKIKLIYNGVNTERFKRNRKETTETAKLKALIDKQDRKVITYIGQFTDDKGFIIAISAMKKIMNHKSNCIFLLAGGGKYVNFLEETIKKEPFKGRVFNLGVISNAEDLLNLSDIVIVPSMWHEAFGYIVAEAGACDVPVIGSDIGGIPEIIVDHETGLLIEPGSESSLVDALEELLTDENKLRKMSENCRNHIVNSFSLDNMIVETYNTYRMLIEKNRS